MLIAAALALAAGQAVGLCPVPPGAEVLWQPAIRYLLIGEIHGTVETPAAFADLVCAAARSGRPVTVALEYSSDSQPVVDAFLASNGDAEARAALLALPIWQDEWQDGRSSTAFLALFERLRVLKQAQLIRGVVCSDTGKDTPKTMPRDAVMARNWQAVTLGSNGLLIALAGNVHMMRRPVEQPGITIHTAGSLMPRERTMTVDVRYNGGKAWSCQQDGCGVHAAGRARRVEPGLVPTTDPAEHFDAVLELGRSMRPCRRSPNDANSSPWRGLSALPASGPGFRLLPEHQHSLSADHPARSGKAKPIGWIAAASCFSRAAICS